MKPNVLDWLFSPLSYILILVLICFLSLSAQHPPKAALSAEAKAYLQGKGMGLAKVAELNHYPGPKHVLELKQALLLSEQQVLATETVFAHMQQTAIQIGKAYLNKEQELEQLFSTNQLNQAKLKPLLADIAKLKAELRYTHLAAHIQMHTVLSSEQITEYDRLRGYATARGEHSHTGGKQHE